MAELKTDKIILPKDFQIELHEGWTLGVDIQSHPTTYTLTHGKKSLSFSSDVVKKLCTRQYGIRLVKGRKQMIVPSPVLQSFVDNALFFQWYDSGVNINDVSQVT